MLLILSLSIFFLVSLAVVLMGTPWLRRWYGITCAAALLLLLYTMHVRTPLGDENWHSFCLRIFPLLALQVAPFTFLFYGAYSVVKKARASAAQSRTRQEAESE